MSKYHEKENGAALSGIEGKAATVAVIDDAEAEVDRRIRGAVDLLSDIGKEDYELFKSLMADLLGKVDPKMLYGQALYDALARLTWSIAFEAVALRVNDQSGKVEVYLRRRAMSEMAYPGEWHCPGAVKLPGERVHDQSRRLGSEFGTQIVHLTHVSDLDIDEARGSFLSQIFLVELEGEPRLDDRHQWFPVDRLPEVTVDHHRDVIIPQAVLAYLSTLDSVR